MSKSNSTIAIESTVARQHPNGSSRRRFLGILGIGAALIADPERLIWTPGKRLISIPVPKKYGLAYAYTDGIHIYYQMLFDQASHAWNQTLTERHMDLQFMGGTQW
jgi:hypothetical protein